jgi:hypothetical protein
MTYAQRQIREQQLRILLACGERGPVLQRLFGVSTRTIKRVVRHTATAIPTGRSAAPTRGWLGRDRHLVEHLLQRWLHEGLDKFVAGEAPTWLRELARDLGLPNAAAIAAIVQRIEVHEDEADVRTGGAAQVRLQACHHCQFPLVSVYRGAGQPHHLSPCPNLACPGTTVTSMRITDLAEWRRRRARHEERR